jgi:CubicO group peptidase (beta-lactamase class C family)
MNSSQFKLMITTLAAALLSGPATAVTDRPGFSEEVDRIFAAVDKSDAPGCAVAVIGKGEFIHKAGYGMANLELDVPLTPESVFRMASVSKQFTAAAVLLLADQGLVDLDEDIRTYLPELPDYGAEVTVRAMLGHFSGMGDYDLIASSYEGEKAQDALDLKSAAGGDFRLGNEDYLTIREFYDVVKKVPLSHQPDTKFQYSNLAYFLLSMLVEERSGMSLRNYAEKHIFTPLDMGNSFFSDDGIELIKNRAYGYKPNKEGVYVNDMTNLFWVGDGGLHTTVVDLIKWDGNFYNPLIGKNPKAFAELMNTPNSQHIARNDLYANGQFAGKIEAHDVFRHSGGWLGFSTFYARFQEDKFSVAVLCNDASQKPEDYAAKIARLYFN